MGALLEGAFTGDRRAGAGYEERSNQRPLFSDRPCKSTGGSLCATEGRRLSIFTLRGVEGLGRSRQGPAVAWKEAVRPTSGSLSEGSLVRPEGGAHPSTLSGGWKGQVCPVRVTLKACGRAFTGAGRRLEGGSSMGYPSNRASCRKQRTGLMNADRRRQSEQREAIITFPLRSLVTTGGGRWCLVD